MHGIHLSVARKNESLARCFCASWLRPEKARSAVRQRTQYQIALETFTLGHKCFRKKCTLKQMSWNIFLWKILEDIFQEQIFQEHFLFIMALSGKNALCRAPTHIVPNCSWDIYS